MKDKKGYKLFQKQASVIDIMWIDNETAIALCDDGKEEDSLYLLKDKVPFEFRKLVEKSIFVKLFDNLNRQLVEMIKNGEK